VSMVGWIFVGLAALVVLNMVVMAVGSRNAPPDPSELDGPELFIPDEWPEPWPHERDTSTVRHGGLGK
jgi:hypothetical protein